LTGLERIQALLRGTPVDHTPVAPLLGAHAVARAGITYDVACQEASAQADALLRTVEAHQPDAVFTLMDLSAEPEALGATAEWASGRPPVIVRHLSCDELHSARLEERILTARVPVFIEAVSRLRHALGDRVAVGALVCGPLTAVSNTVGIENLARMLRRDRALVADLLVRMAAACIVLQRQYARAGAHAVALLEPVATSAILSPADLEELLLAQLQGITAAARTDGVLSALHVCGDCRPSLPALSRCGAEVLSLDAEVDLPAARAAVADRIALMGNLDVRHLLPHGRPEQVFRAARELVGRMEGRLILSGGCELPPETPAESVLSLTRAARS
jgi:uroporphyrinogen decarboxylase